MSVHLTAADDAKGVLQLSSRLMKERFNIHYCTIQVERSDDRIECKHFH
jgi:hypothetical protein